jgi:hypothetical protein
MSTEKKVPFWKASPAAKKSSCCNVVIEEIKDEEAPPAAKKSSCCNMVIEEIKDEEAPPAKGAGKQ